MIPSTPSCACAARCKPANCFASGPIYCCPPRSLPVQSWNGPAPTIGSAESFVPSAPLASWHLLKETRPSPPGRGAVGGTLGDDGLVWDTSNPALLAESMAAVMTCSDVKERLVREQRRRFDCHFTPEAIGRAFDRALAPLLDKR